MILDVLHRVLSFVRYWNFSKYNVCSCGLLGVWHSVVSVPCEEYYLQDVEKTWLVRVENFQFPLDLHHSRPQWTHLFFILR